MSRFHRSIGILAAAAALASLAACGSASTKTRSQPSTPAGTAATTATTEHLTVGLIPIADTGEYFTAEAQGFFAQEHLSVTSATIAGGATLIPALESGAMNVGFSNLVSVLQAGEHNFGVKCLAGTLKKPATGHNLSLLVSPKYAGEINSAKDLDGKSIAVNTLQNINQLVAEAWMQKHGGDPSSVHFVAVNFPDMPAEIQKGDVVAAITDEPFTTISLNAGAKLLDPRPYQAIAPTPLYSCWLVSSSWLSSHEQAAKGFVTALNDAGSYLAAHPDYLRQILPKYTQISAQLAKVINLPDVTTELSVADLKVWETAALRFGLLSKPVDLNSLVAHLGS